MSAVALLRIEARVQRASRELKAARAEIDALRSMELGAEVKDCWLRVGELLLRVRALERGEA